MTSTLREIESEGDVFAHPVLRDLRLNLNESAYPPLPAVAAILHQQVGTAHRYPEFLPDGPRAAIAAHLRIGTDRVTVGAGATGVAAAVLHASADRARTAGYPRPSVATCVPTFDGYPILAAMAGLAVTAVPLRDDGGLDLASLGASVRDDTAAVVVCSPHNPTGAVCDEDELRAFLAALPVGVDVILDQAYVEFSMNPPDLRELLRCHPRLVVVRTFSKAYGLAGLRIGYGIGRPAAISDARRFEIPFGVNPAARDAVPVALAATRDLDERVDAMRVERERLARGLTRIGLAPLPSEGNFLFVPGDAGLTLGDRLAASGILTKACPPHGVRITVGDRIATDHVLAVAQPTRPTTSSAQPQLRVTPAPPWP